MKPLTEKIKEINIPSGWEKKCFNDLFTFSGGLTASREQLSEEGVCYLHYGDIHTSNKNFIDVEKENEILPKLDINKDALKADIMLNNGDVVFVDASEDYEGVSKHVIIKNENNIAFVAGLHTIVAKSIDASLNIDYKKYCFQTNTIKKQFYFYATGIKVYGISKANISRLVIALPPLSEQQKNAEILSTCDKLIELKEKLIEEKKRQKKWMMQSLLDTESEVRLPGFDGKYSSCVLYELGSTYGGLAGKNKNDFGSGKPYVPYLNIFCNSIINNTLFDYVEISEHEVQNKVKFGDIFFTTSSETPDEVGMSSVLLSDFSELYLNSFCFGFRLRDFDTLNPRYAAYYFRGKKFRSILNTLAQGATRFNLSKKSLLERIINIPEIEEQIAIAEVLFTAEREIELLQKELTELQKQKKALMQLLLTGLVRVYV